MDCAKAVLPLLTGDTKEDWDVVLSCLVARASITLSTSEAVLRIADKYDMPQLLKMATSFLCSPEAGYTEAPASSGDPGSIWRFLAIASDHNQPQIVQHLQQLILQRKMVPEDPRDLTVLRPADAQQLLLMFMKANAQTKYHCVRCAVARTEIKLCPRCEFSHHFRA
jgi:hypothetical protein